MNNFLKKKENDLEYKDQIDELLNEVMKYSEKVRGIYAPVDPQWISRFEHDFKVELPLDYKYLLSKTNGFILSPYDIAGITGTNFSEVHDLYNMYKYEHFEVIVPQFKYLIPFCWDNGNFYCFDTRVRTNGGVSNQVIYWVSNYEYSEQDPPEIVNECLADFIKGWILKNVSEWYDYEGNDYDE